MRAFLFRLFLLPAMAYGAARIFWLRLRIDFCRFDIEDSEARQGQLESESRRVRQNIRATERELAEWREENPGLASRLRKP